MKVRFDIKGIDCPHCAMDLQKKMCSLEPVKEATINFAIGSLVVDTHDECDEEGLLDLMQQCADDFEDGISIDLRD